MLRDPAEEKRPPCAEQKARVDVSRRGDDAFFEQPVDLVGDGLEHALDDHLARPRIVVDEDDLVVSACVVRERRREWEAVGPRRVQGLEHVIGDTRADHLKQHRGRHRHSHRHHRLVDVFHGGSVFERVHEHACHSRQDAIDDEAGRIRHEHGAFAQFRRDVERGCERRVVRFLRAHDLDQWHHRDRIEEVHADDALRCA